MSWIRRRNSYDYHNLDKKDTAILTKNKNNNRHHSPSISKMNLRSSLFSLTNRVKSGEYISHDGHDVDDMIAIDQNYEDNTSDRYNYALLIALYTLQGIPIGLSASIPFLIQQKVKAIATAVNTFTSISTDTTSTILSDPLVQSAVESSISSSSISKSTYNAQAIFALCSWPFSLKLLWAPIVDALFIKSFGRRKTWLVPVQTMASLLMIFGSNYVEQQLNLVDIMNAQSLSVVQQIHDSFSVKGITAFFFGLYFLMATQDIAVDGWALTMLSKKNRGKGPVCNSIGQNLGYFLSFVGFLALNDVESSEKLWRPLFGLKSRPGVALVSLGQFIRFMGYIMFGVTTFVTFFKHEHDSSSTMKIEKDMEQNSITFQNEENNFEDDEEIDASQIGLKETYRRLWHVCKLPSVQSLFLILFTNRFATALSDKVKFLKAVEYGMSKQTTALLAPTIILPLGILVPIISVKLWKGQPLRQFMTAYKLRVTLVPLLDVIMLLTIRSMQGTSHDIKSQILLWCTIIASTSLFSIVDSMQFNAQMVFFAHRVDPAIGGTYMTLLNTAANLGSTWPTTVIMYLMGQLTIAPECKTAISSSTGVSEEICKGGRDAYFILQGFLSTFGCLWVYLMGKRVQYLASLPDYAWCASNADSNKGKRME